MGKFHTPLPGSGGGSGEPYDDTEIRGRTETLEASVGEEGVAGRDPVPAYVEADAPYVVPVADTEIAVATRLQTIPAGSSLFQTIGLLNANNDAGNGVLYTASVAGGNRIALTGRPGGQILRVQMGGSLLGIPEGEYIGDPGADPVQGSGVYLRIEEHAARIVALENVVIGDPPIPGEAAVPSMVTGTSPYSAPAEETDLTLGAATIQIQPGATLEFLLLDIASVFGGQITAQADPDGIVTIIGWTGLPLQVYGGADMLGIPDGVYDNGQPAVPSVPGTGVSEHLSGIDTKLASLSAQLDFSLSVPVSVSTSPIDAPLPVGGSIWVNGSEVVLTAGMVFEDVFNAFAGFANPGSWYAESNNTVIHLRGVIYLSISAEQGIADALGLPTDFWEQSATVRDELLAMEVKQADFERRLLVLEELATAP